MSADLVPGLSYVPRYIDEAEEAELVAAIDASPWRHDLKRRVQHYGYRYDYRARAASESDYLGPLPDWLTPLCQRLVEEGYFQTAPDQVIVNEYQPGQGIAAHIDCVPCFGGTIASLSLGSPVVMEFTHAQTGERHDTTLEPGSLLCLSGPARTDWRHAIAARKTDMIAGVRVLRARRLSLTFRTMRLPQPGCLVRSP